MTRVRLRTPEARAERLAKHAAETDPAAVQNAALRLLDSRARTTSDLRTRLARSGYPAALIEGVVARLAEVGLLDDTAYARGWLESRDRGRPRGERALRVELRQRGVPSEMAETALEERRAAAEVEAGEPSADDVAATRLLERRAAALGRGTDLRVRRQRAYGLLARNGFDPDVAGRVAGTWSAAFSPDVDDAPVD